MILSLDTETTGLDFAHGARPFFVTTCDDKGEVRFWEWEVDPLTRIPFVPESDLDDIENLIDEAELVVFHNAKFDVTALTFLRRHIGENWDWSKTVDTLLGAHLLSSKLPKNLTDLAIRFLGVNIEPYETKLHKACEEARRYARKQFPDWAIAKSGRPDMPSAKEKCWKYDTWLPRALLANGYDPVDAGWDTVTSEYANADSATTLALWVAMKREIERRGLGSIYRERLKVLPVAYTMERRGITISGSRLAIAEKEYRDESEKAGRVCVNIAQSLGYELDLPEGGNNKSLRTFCFDILKLPHLKNSGATGEPSLDKGVLESYESILPERSKALTFVRTLRGKRKRDTALTYMSSYRRFWKEYYERDSSDYGRGNNRGSHLVSNPPSRLRSRKRRLADWFILHPSLNPVGTDTLRWSCANPNEQNISKQEGFNLRYTFGPAPGREWWSLDAKNIELRLPAYAAGEDEMIALFERPNDPPYYGSNHILVFSILWPKLWEEGMGEVGIEKVGAYCKKKYASSNYQWTKNGNFAVQYGAIDREDGSGTADRAYHLPGAQSRIKARFSKMEKLNQWCIRFAEKHGYVETMPDKTVDPKGGYPLMCTRTEYGRILPTVPLNYHIQGTAMWWMMKAMIRCYDQLASWRKEEGLDAYVIMQVHDELVFDFPKSVEPPPSPKSNLSKMRIIQSLMSKGGDDIGVPTPVSIEYHPDNWGTGTTFE